MKTTGWIGKRTLAAALLLGAGCPDGVRALERQMLYSLEVVGGQYFFKGERGSVSANASGSAAAVILLNENWTLLPSIASRYQGTKQVVDLVGAGSLFQQQMDHRLGVEGIYRRPGSNWALKPSLTYKVQLLKETLDETWTEGLFDYQLLDIGFEAERSFPRRHSLRFGADYVRTHFPNYASLESQIALDFRGQSLARELVGDKVLDSNTFLAWTSLNASLAEGITFESDLKLLRRTFPRQRIVDGSGLLTSKSRGDFVTRLAGSVGIPIEPSLSVRLEPRMHGSVSSTVSDQNNYDARRAEFQPGYYNTFDIGIGPELRASLGDLRQPVRLSCRLDLERRRYPHRKVQDVSGTYREETVRQNSTTLAASLSYPMSPHVTLMTHLRHRRTSSNQGFEQFFSYNYSATSFQAGFRYEY